MRSNMRSYRHLSAMVLGLILMVSACAPNSVNTPAQAPLDDTLAAAEQESGRYGTLLRLASSTRSAGDPAAAVNMYQQAISLERGRPEAYTLLGDTLVELKAYDQAAEVFEQSLARNDGSLAARLGYAKVLMALQRPEAAIPHYQAVMEQSPGSLQAHNGLGVAYDLIGEHQTAQQVYRDGLAIAPDSMLLRNNLGLSLSLAGDHEDAISLLRMIADEPGAQARNRQNLALAYGLAGDLAAAERISRLDLDEESVKNNVAYFAALAAIDDRSKRAAALGTHAGKTDESAAFQHRLSALALEGEGLELSLIPTGRWFLNLGEFSGSADVASAWRTMRSQYRDVLGDLDRLAGTEQGSQPLLVGPLANAKVAEELCATLQGRGQPCRALAL